MLIIVLVLAGVVFDPLHPVPSLPLAGVLGLQLLHCLTAGRDRRLRWTLAAQVLLLPWAGPAAAGPVAASALLLLRGRSRRVVFAGVVLGAGLMVPAEPFAVALALLNAVCQGLVLFGVTRLGRTRAAVHAVRAELVAAAVAEERSRASRDLDDALGTALSGILALAARGELAEIIRVSRQAAALARSVPERPSPASAPPEDLLPRLALPILLTVHGGYLLIALIYLGGRPGPALLAAAVLGLQLHHSLPRPPGERPAGLAWTSTALLVLTVATLLHPGQAYPQLVGFAAATFLLLGRWWTLGAAGLLAFQTATLALRDHPTGEVLYWAFNSLAVAAMLHALAVQTRLVFEAREARLALAAIAVSRERRRISRDVHDLLGQGLSAITVRAELALRLSPADAVTAELSEITATAHRSLTALRAIPYDEDPDLSLDAELTSARALLEAAGIHVTIHRTSRRDDRLLAIVLREAVTNVLRHSTATHCLLHLDATGLRIRNDGATTPTRPGGRGTTNLTDRVRAAGGHLTVHQADGHHELTVLHPS
ncbi:sensor histidine kinase [Kitasatospora sp. NPDC004289]